MDPTDNSQNPMEFENQNSNYVKRNMKRESYLILFLRLGNVKCSRESKRSDSR